MTSLYMNTKQEFSAFLLLLAAFVCIAASMPVVGAILGILSAGLFAVSVKQKA